MYINCCRLEKYLAGEFFSQEELDTHKKYLQLAHEKAKTSVRVCSETSYL